MMKEKTRILLVEDNPGDARLVEELLKEVLPEGFDLHWEDTLEGALEELDTAKFDVILCDLGLPRSSGLATFAKVYLEAAGVPIIVVTSLDDENIAVEAVRHGAQDYLVKDELNTQTLLRSVRFAQARRLAHTAVRKAVTSATDINAALRIISGACRQDMQNDLWAIKGNVELYQLNREETLLNAISSVIGRCEVMIENMNQLEATIVEDDALHSVDVRALANSVIEEYSDWSGTFSVTGEGSVLADNSLRIAVGSLVRNAIQHSETDTVEIHIEECEEYVDIEVIDQGVGIPESFRQSVFKPGFQMDQDRRSAGLGLYVVSRLAERCGGYAWVEDNMPKGSKFIIRLPRPGFKALRTTALLSNNGRVEPDTELEPTTIKVLHIDDNNACLDITKAFLNSLAPELEIHTFCDAETAIQQLKDDGYDVVVCDHAMPDIDGLQVLVKVREQKEYIPFILFASIEEQTVVTDAQRLGADFCLGKAGESVTIFTKLTHMIRECDLRRRSKALTDN